jgi:hypothetical protein
MITAGLGHGPVNETYRLSRYTRCEFATLAKMARQAGDLSREDAAAIRMRIARFEKGSLIRYSTGRRCYELRPAGWRIVTDAESAWILSLTEAA